MFREFWYAKLSSIENWERNSRNWLLLSILSETQFTNEYIQKNCGRDWDLLDILTDDVTYI